MVKIIIFIYALAAGSLLNSLYCELEQSSYRLTLPFNWSNNSNKLLPYISLLTALLTSFLFYKYDFTINFLICHLLVFTLILISIIDLKQRVIPDFLVMFIFVLGIISIFINFSTPALLSHILGLMLGGGLFYTMALFSVYGLKKEGMGGGDIKLMAAIGFLVGVKLCIVILILSVYICAVVICILIILKRKTMLSTIPFGPFICIGAYISLMFGYEIYNGILSLYI